MYSIRIIQSFFIIYAIILWNNCSCQELNLAEAKVHMDIDGVENKATVKDTVIFSIKKNSANIKEIKRMMYQKYMKIIESNENEKKVEIWYSINGGTRIQTSCPIIEDTIDGKLKEYSICTYNLSGTDNKFNITTEYSLIPYENILSRHFLKHSLFYYTNLYNGTVSYSKIDTDIIFNKGEKQMTCYTNGFITGYSEALEISYPNYNIKIDKEEGKTTIYKGKFDINSYSYKGNITGYNGTEKLYLIYADCYLPDYSVWLISIGFTICFLILMIMVIALVVIVQIRYRKADRKELTYFQHDNMYMKASGLQKSERPVEVYLRRESKFSRYCCFWWQRWLHLLVLWITDNPAFSDPTEFAIPDAIEETLRSKAHPYTMLLKKRKKYD
mmetsp:Transcript_4622/g.6812  ORF Transcript_4622/g.6812 Transcript_4622/m.6812 type:complete len:386 (+) Transcript_4622:81-1238(+)